VIDNVAAPHTGVNELLDVIRIETSLSTYRTAEASFAKDVGPACNFATSRYL
jgi:hypothetical protein